MSSLTNITAERSPLEFDQPDRLAKSLRIARMTSNAMAAHLGVSRTTISNYINGRTTPDRSQRRDWALKTGVPLDYIEDGIIPEDWTPPTHPADPSEKITEVLLANNVTPLFPHTAPGATKAA